MVLLPPMQNCLTSHFSLLTSFYSYSARNKVTNSPKKYISKVVQKGKIYRNLTGLLLSAGVARNRFEPEIFAGLRCWRQRCWHNAIGASPLGKGG